MLFRLELAFGDEVKGVRDKAKGERLEAKGEGDEVKGERLEAKGKGDEVKGAENSEADDPASRLNEDWQALLDKLRINGLLEYWLDKRYHDLAAEELKKVDWTQQPDCVKRMYMAPIWMLKAKQRVMLVGSFAKQMTIKMLIIR